MTRHPSVTQLLRFFAYSHLSEPMAGISKRYSDLAHQLAADGQLDGPELTVALRKLLESKDCAVRAALPPE